MNNQPALSVEKIASNLLADPESRTFHVTLCWILYHIVAANKSITHAKLKKVVQGEYGIELRLIELAIASLTSKTLFNAVWKWQNPKHRGSDAEVAAHLSVKENEDFAQWLEEAATSFPELRSYAPLTVKKSESDQQKAQ